MRRQCPHPLVGVVWFGGLRPGGFLSGFLRRDFPPGDLRRGDPPGCSVDFFRWWPTIFFRRCPAGFFRAAPSERSERGASNPGVGVVA